MSLVGAVKNFDKISNVNMGGTPELIMVLKLYGRAIFEENMLIIKQLAYLNKNLEKIDYINKGVLTDE